MAEQRWIEERLPVGGVDTEERIITTESIKRISDVLDYRCDVFVRQKLKIQPDTRHERHAPGDIGIKVVRLKRQNLNRSWIRKPAVGFSFIYTSPRDRAGFDPTQQPTHWNGRANDFVF